MVRNRTIHYGMILSAVVWCWLLADMGANASAAEAVCAVVKIEIRQELTLERQAFDAHMKITNGLTSLPLEDVKVTVTFADEEGNTVLASSETTEQEDVAFFIRPDSEGITKGSDGGWDIDDVAPVSEADLHWLIIPTPGSADAQPQGKLYYVGARLSYTLGGQTHVTEVTPDYIYVKPLPQMVLDYFLTRNVYGDDAWTSENESPVPFTLGVRVQNIGHNTAHDLKIDSAQPEIVENEQGLLIGFEITGSQVNGEPAEKSLLVDFGDLAPDATAVARWIMTCTLSGEFTDFTANISHADELGGELTSIIKQDNVHTHLLVKDVLVDLPGRDKIHDFLTVDAAFYKVFESNGTETETTDLSADTTWELHQETATRYTCDVSTPASAGFVYLSFPDPDHPQNQQAQLEELIRQDKLIEVIRSDGKRIKPANAWRSQQRKADPKDGWHYFVNLFDTSSTGSYTFVFDDVTSHNSPPALLPLSDQATAEGQELSFAVSATDPDGTIPEISAVNLPVGADLEEQSDGSAKFTWTPAIGQAGDYDLTFRASDGELSDSQAVTVTVYPHNDTDGDGLDDAWERQYFGNLDRDGTGDYDGDGISDRDEFLLGLDPTRTDHAPTIPGLADPAFGGQVDTLSPTLTIINSHDADGDEIFYEFELFGDEAGNQAIAQVSDIPAGDQETTWQPDATLADNSWYYWRVRATDGVAYSLWAYGRFFVNTANDAPGAFYPDSPDDQAETAALSPRLAVTNSVDPDGDELTYTFEVYDDAGLASPVTASAAIPAADGPVTAWDTEMELVDGNTYYWRAIATDEHGAATATETAAFVVNTANQAPAAPEVVSPAADAILTSPETELVVGNASDADHDPLTYYFEIDTTETFHSPALISSAAVSEGPDTTSWPVTGLADNTVYYWRAKASDGAAESPWTYGGFLVNTANDAPALPVIKNPGRSAWSGVLRPELSVLPVPDPDPDAGNLEYTFEVYTDEACQNLILQKETDLGFFTPESDLDNNAGYYWRVMAADEYQQTAGWTDPAFFFIHQTNQAPEINGNPPTSVKQGENFSFTPVTEDPDPGDILTFAITNKPAWAVFDTATGNLSGFPENDDVGQTSGIVITVTDSQGASASLGPFDLTVENVNDAPVISGTPPVSVDEDTEYSFTPTAEDIDAGDSLAFGIDNKPSWASFDPDTGRLSGTPANDDVGVSTGIVITVTDLAGAEASLPPFDIEVINVNDPPQISGTPDTAVDEDTLYSFTPTAVDVDADDTLTFAIANQPDWAVFDPTTGTLSGIPENADVGVSTGIIITVTDAAGATASLSPFAVEVINVNDPPQISGTPPTSVDEDTEYSFTPTASDVDMGDILTFSIANQPDWAVFDPATGTLSGVPENDDVGLTTGIVISVTDTAGAEDSLPPFDLEVINVNDPPVAVNDSYNLDEDTPLVINAPGVLANDIDVDVGDILTATLLEDVSNGSLALNSDGSFNYIPEADYFGADAFYYRADDGMVGSEPAMVVFNISPVNDMPEISSLDDFVMVENTAVTDLGFTVHDVESSAEDLAVTAASDNPDLISAENIVLTGTGASRTLSVMPAENQHGAANLTLTVTDPSDGSSSETFQVTVTPKTDPPVVRYFILNPELLSGSLRVTSLEDGNRISAGAVELELERYESGSIDSSDLEPGDAVCGTGHFGIAGSADDTGLPVPEAFAGRNFVIPHVRGTHTYYIFSPYGRSSVTVDQGTGGETLSLAKGEVRAVDAGSADDMAGLVRSDLPVVVSHAASCRLGFVTMPVDAFPVAPAAGDLWGIRGENTYIGALKDDTTVTVHRADGSVETLRLQSGSLRRVPASRPGRGRHLLSDQAVHITADKPVAAVQTGGHRSDDAATVLLDSSYLAKRYAIPVNAKSVTVVCPQPDTALMLYHSAAHPGLPFAADSPWTAVCGREGDRPASVSFGWPGNSGVLEAGVYLESNHPVYLIYETDDLFADERNLLGDGYTADAPGLISAVSHYVLDPAFTGSDARVVSLAPDNLLVAGDIVLELGKYDSARIPQSVLTPGTRIAAAHACSIASEVPGAGLPVPGDFGGTDFVLPHIPDNDLVYLLSPDADTEVTVDIDGYVDTFSLSAGMVHEYRIGEDDIGATRITAATPILVSRSGLTGQGMTAACPVLPADRDLWGFAAPGVALAALADDTRVRIDTGGGDSRILVLNAGERHEFYPDNNNGGCGPAVHITADKPVAAMQYNPADPRDNAVFWGADRFSKTVGLPVAAERVAVICTEPGVMVMLRGDRRPTDVSVSGQSHFFKSWPRFGAGSDDSLTPFPVCFEESPWSWWPGAARPGDYITASSPVYVVYDSGEGGGRNNVIGEQKGE